jgi:hypothetical protein
LVRLGVLGALVVDLFDFHAPFTDLQPPCPVLDVIIALLYG